MSPSCMFARSLASAARRGIGPAPAIRLRQRAPPALPAVGRVPHLGASRCLATSGTGGGPAPPPGSGDEKKADEKKESRWTRIQAPFRQHGLVFVGYYTATWIGGFGVCWGGVSIAGLDGVALLQWLGADAVFDTTALYGMCGVRLESLLYRGGTVVVR